ncbi:MAG: hypothetical protein ACREIR_19705 [Geminicoccaceae bacterium]
MSRPTMAVVVHDLQQARGALAAAAELGCAIRLRSAPGAAAYAGVGYLKALGDTVGHELLIDCGDDPGIAMAALRTGCRRLNFTGDAATAQRLGEMAEQVGAILVHETADRGALELAPEDDAATLVRAQLQRELGRGNET